MKASIHSRFPVSSLCRRAAAVFTAFVLLLGGIPASAVRVDARYSTVAGGMSHSLAMTTSGEVYVWGSNAASQLGLGPEVSEAKKPTKLEGLTATSVAAGYDFSAVLTTQGAVYTWGFGQVETPEQVPGLSGILSIAAGQSSLLAVQSDGTVWQWDFGGTPAKVPGLERIVAVSCGAAHYLALSADGQVYAWGSNSSGQLGTGTTESSSTPVRVEGLFNIISISAGANHSLASDFSGRVYAWGSNTYGQLGNNSTEDSLIPVELSRLEDVTSVSAGYDTSMAISQGTVYTWGYGEYGQMGTGESTNATRIPKKISMSSSASNQKEIIAIDCGVYHCMCVDASGQIYAWGRNRSYQVGNAKDTNADEPQSILKDAAHGDGHYATSILLDGISSWARSEAIDLEACGLLSPMQWSSFQEGITRARFVHMLVGAYESVHNTVRESNTSDFEDIEGHLLESDLRKGITLGIISGTSDSTISPDDTVTRESAATMLCSFLRRMEDVTISESDDNVSFYTDGWAISAWAAPYVRYAYEENIMTGDSEGAFHPRDLLTQESCIIILARLAETYDWVAE